MNLFIVHVNITDIICLILILGVVGCVLWNIRNK